MTAFAASARRVSALGLATGLFLVQACGGSDPAAPSPTITIALNAGSASAPQGGSAVTGITVTGAGGFSATPAVTVTGAPTGVTSSVSTIATAGSVSTGTVTLNVAGTTTPGVYPLTINATGSGVVAVTSTFTLTVTAFSFTQTFSPTTVSIAQGATGTSTLTIARTNLTGSVAFAVTGAPAGVTAVMVPATTTGTSSSLQITNAINATLGNAVLTVTSTSAGAVTQVSTVTLVVTAAVGIPLTATPAALSVARGTSGVSSIGLARTEFTIPVTLTAENLPAGVTAAFVSNPTTGTLSSLTLTASAGATQGVATVTIRATGAGLPSSTTTIQLTVP